mgnify:CR=1 FL=1
MVQTLANWGEFLGGIAVVVSLLYVGIQVRSSVRQSRVDSYTRISELWSQWTSMVASDDETSRIYYQGTQDFDSLNAVERTRFNLIIGMYFGIFETIIVHEKSGAYDPETFRRNLNTAYAVFTRPGVQAWWQKNEGRAFAPDTEKYLLSRREAEASNAVE